MTDINSFYIYGGACWLTVQGTVLAVWPQELLHFLYSPIITEALEGATAVPDVASANQLNILRVLGVILIAIAVATLFIRPSTPPSQLPSPREPMTPLTTTRNTGLPTLKSIVLPLTMIVHITMAGYAYTQYMNENTWRWQVIMLGGVVFAATGCFSLLFSEEVPVPDNKTPLQQRKEQKEL